MFSFMYPKIGYLKRLSVSLIMILTMGCGLINDVIPTPVKENNNNGVDIVDITTSEGKTMNLLVNNENNGDNFSISLSEGDTEYQPPEELPVVIGEPLSQEEIEELLSRLPNLPQM
ncbi:MAG TPA: hypothetical protein VK856_02000, partial [Anaerolineaceae bacterium]|nr:hypothetical protein [Anaerolineaceae bacterium]